MTQTPRAMRDVLLNQIWQAMADDDSIYFVSADFGSPILDKIRADYPDRFVNVGIAEQNLINISAGLALEGFKVFAYAIAPFITMRCYEQVRVSLALLSEVRPMNVNLIGVGAGYSYVVSGPTHQCYEDITLMRALPNFRFYSPADQITAENLISACLENTGPKYLRFDAQVLPMVYSDGQKPDMKRGFEELKEGKDIAIVATGYMVHTALKVAELLKDKGIDIGVLDLYDLATFSQPALKDKLERYKGLVSLEEGFRGRGGLDALLFDLMNRENWRQSYLNLGVEPGYRFELGSRDELHEQVGIGVAAVTDQVVKFAEQWT